MKEKTIRDGTMMLCKEIDEIVDKGKLTAGDLDTLHKLSDTVKNFLKIEMLEGEGDGYSERGYSRGDEMYSERRDSMGRYSRDDGYERGSSYARRGTHYVRGHYSRDDGMGAGMRETRGGYSRADSKDRMMHEMGELMEEATEDERRTLERAMMIIRKA